jgi:hypothetical protein
MSSGIDERSWVSPEWGQSSFLHHVRQGLRGAADANGDKRVTGGELVDYVSTHVHDWARDQRGSLQTPVLLPFGDEGKQRVAAMHLVTTDGPPPEDEAPLVLDSPPELNQAWDEYRELAGAYVPPATYTPYLWRKYEAWIMRFEQAIIAGDAEGAKIARSKASDCRRGIEAARLLAIGPQTLTLVSGLGGQSLPGVTPEAFRLGIEQLAATPAVEQPRLWVKLRHSTGLDHEVSSLLWCRTLLEWVASDPLPRLPAVPSLVSLVSDGMTIRPAELNFLLMLQKNLPPTDKSEVIGPLLKRVLRLRLDAEQAAMLAVGSTYPVAEWIGSHTLDQLHTADNTRRSAEDLCFATRATDWQQASLGVENAERLYRARIETANVLREFIGTWHQSAASLPNLTDWLAHGPPGNSLERLPNELLFQARRAIWKNTHEIAAALPMLVTGPPNDELAATRSAAAYSADGMRLLNDLLVRQVEELLAGRSEFDARPTPRSGLVRWWQTAATVLTAPPPSGLPTGKRAELVREFRRVSRQLLVTGRTPPQSLPNVSPEITREEAFSAARRRGLLLLDRLRVIATPLQPLAPAPGFPQQLANVPEQADTPEFRFNHFAFQAAGRQSLAEAGSRCGELLALAANNAEKADNLAAADRWLRVVTPAAEVSDALVDRLRRERVQAMLVQQARRTYLDYWYGEGNTRYYRTAIERLAADAQKLGANSTPDPFNAYLGAEGPFPVALAAPGRVTVTDEPNPELKIGFLRQPPPDVLGVPLFWATPTLTAEARLAVPLDSRTPTPTLIRPLAKLTTPRPQFPVPEIAPLQIHGFFRGRMIETSVPVEVYRLPDRIATTNPGLNTTAIAVRADPRIRAKYGFGTGAVAVVLDCSGSLGPVDRKNPLDRGLYPEAIKALDTLLHDLPPGTILNVWVFGQRSPEANSPEETIHEVLPPTQVPYDSRAIIEKVQTEVSRLDPWDLSPVVRAALMARDRIQQEPVPFKAVVLISDGVDTRYDSDQKNLKKRSVKDALRAEFSHGDISLSIVALPTDKSERIYQNEFQVVTELKPAGKFVTKERVKELTAWLRNGLNPRVRFALDPVDAQTTSGDLTAGGDGADNWYGGRLEPGTYRFQMSGAKEFTRLVQLQRGDRLLLDLRENRDAIELQRHWFADTVVGVKSRNPNDPTLSHRERGLGGEGDPWRLTLLQNRSEANGLRLFTSIEDRPGKAEPVSVARIGDVWFELRPLLPDPKPVSVHWRFAPGYPAPSWTLDIPGWPAFPGGKAAATPLLETWWNPDRPFPATGAWVAPVGKPIATLSGQSAKIGDTTLTLDSVTVEKQAVAGRPEESCLVIRLTHPPGNPVWVKPLGARASGSEVRFYRGANKVTCLFWGLDITQVTGLDVILLNDALRRAKERGHFALLDNIPTPTDNSPLPEPPVEVR